MIIPLIPPILLTLFSSGRASNDTLANTTQIDELVCQSISMYYYGTFQHHTNRSRTFDAQIELNLNADLNDKRIYLKINHFNKSFTGEDLGFALGNFRELINCYTSNITENCSVPFIYNNLFHLYFWKPSLWYGPDLIYFPPTFNNSFVLLNPVRGCAQDLKGNNHRYSSDQSLYKQCICCGESYSPDQSLKCPINIWE